ncbi:Transcription factor BIM2 [Ananas comosus]|uniref:Transcription factor BIM2 n=1 Tax=Ananas comosus TaxID=4615 RepID=A0A199V9N9_ANACO|nr:Transcription factor BIM2 [Ananas comosus]
MELQGFYLKTHDFLQPLERAEEARKKERGDESAAVGPAEHVLPGASARSASATCPTPARGRRLSPSAARAPPLPGSGPSPNPSPCPSRSGAPARTTEVPLPTYLRAGDRGELGVKIDGNGRGGGNDQRPNTPRSKHSATEQRRRSKINDRQVQAEVFYYSKSLKSKSSICYSGSRIALDEFQILRELIPHSDQKRDKASFLLEVIEYIRFLQERVQKYESSCPEWNEDNVKMMPWVKVYFRSFWKNSRNNNRSPENFISDSSQINKSGSAHAQQTLLGKINDNRIQIAHTVTSDAPNPTELNQMAGVSFKATENPPHCPDNNTFQAQNQWLRSPLVADSAFSNEMLNQHEELAIDEGTINVSCHYSQELLTTLSQALQNSGLDLSQASISVQINLGKRAANKRSAAVSTSSPKDHNPAVNNQASEHARAGNTGQEFSEAPKRRRVDNS